ncbi:MAG TPA: phage tail tape measure protein, partial [Chitinophagaceae bacterium]|nr:phage tail tape measure protein [Chitinophagaceae bacterium]
MASDVKNKRVNIFIDQSAAENALANLQTKADGFNKKIEAARKEQEKLKQKIEETGKAGGDVTKLQERYTALGTTINANTKSLKENAEAQKKIEENIKNGINPSFAQQQRLVEQLIRTLKQLPVGSKEYLATLEQYKKANTTFQQLRTEMELTQKVQRNWFAEAKTVAFGVLIGNTVQTALSSLTSYLSGIVTGNAKLSDSLAKVRQTTSLTDAEVKKLSADLKGIDTRTAQSELLKIAEIGGQFNVPKEQLKSFVEQIDRANVVLGSEFGGGAEQITTELSLLRNVFADIKSDAIDQDLGKIGNALVTLAQEGAATAPVVSDFAKRLSPLEATANITSGAVLGLSATLQELAVNPERGGTAVVRLFDKMISNAEAFARVAGLSGEE